MDFARDVQRVARLRRVRGAQDHRGVQEGARLSERGRGHRDDGGPGAIRQGSLPVPEQGEAREIRLAVVRKIGSEVKCGRGKTTLSHELEKSDTKMSSKYWPGEKRTIMPFSLSSDEQ